MVGKASDREESHGREGEARARAAVPARGAGPRGMLLCRGVPHFHGPAGVWVWL